MPCFSYRSPQAVLAGLMLLASSAAAQAPQPAPPPPPAPPASMMPAPTTPAPQTAPTMPAPQTAPSAPLVPPPSAPVVPSAGSAGIDPQAITLFNQTIAAHQALSALKATVTLSSAGLGADTNQTVALAYKKPGSAKVAVSGSAGPIVSFFSNGKTLTLYLVKQKKYRVQPVPPGAETIPLILDQAHALLPRLLGHPEALRELLAQPGVTASVISQSFDGVRLPVSGVAVDTIAVVLPAPDGSRATFTFDIGRTDHLLRRLTENASLTNKGKPQTFTRTETVTALSATPGLTAADFTFIPPPGVTKIKATAQREPQTHDPRLVPGAKPFPVAAKDLRGKPLSLAQYRGKVVLMDFWATWCGPCVGEMPNVIAAYKKYHAQGFDIIGISLDQSRPALTAFIAQNKIPWRQVFDGKAWSSAVPREYGVQAIPFGLLIGRAGQIAAVDVRGPALTNAIRRALAK